MGTNAGAQAAAPGMCLTRLAASRAGLAGLRAPADGQRFRGCIVYSTPALFVTLGMKTNLFAASIKASHRYIFCLEIYLFEALPKLSAQ